MKKFRITFSDGPLGNKHAHRDIEANTMAEASSMGHSLPEAKSGNYTDFTVEEIPDGPTTIGVCFVYYDEMLKRNNRNYMFIKANDEAQAVSYYNKNIKNKHFYQPWPHKPNDDGNCIYKDVDYTYFATYPKYDFDATNT